MRGLSCRLLLVFALGVVAAAASASQVGHALFAHGAVTAQLGSNLRLMGNGTPVFNGDVITSGPQSFAVIEYMDGTRMTVRPDSQLRVDHVSQQKHHESFLLSLFKGGLRAITGLIAKANPNAFHVHTKVATIGIRGTDFSARLCGKDCVAAQAAAKHPSTGVTKPAIVGRVAFVKGTLQAQTVGDKPRRMLVGAAVYPNDMLTTGAASFAVIAFRDETRITLQANSIFQVAKLRYNATDSAKNSALMRLVRGGIRVISGLIEKARPQAFKIETPVATISARGTRFTVVCLHACGQQSTVSDARRSWNSALASGLLDALVPAAHAQVTGAGLVLSVEEGTVVATFLSTGKTAVFKVGQIGLLRPNGMVRLLQGWPKGLPRGKDPGTVRFDKKQFESHALPRHTKGGLIVAVYDEGHAVVQLPDGATLHIGKGEALFANGNKLIDIKGGTPAFIVDDRFNISPAGFSSSGVSPPGKGVENLDCSSP